MNKFSAFVFVLFSILFVSCNSCTTQGAGTERDAVNEYYTLVTDDDKEKNPQIAKRELPQIETLNEVSPPEEVVATEPEPEPEPPKEPEKPVVVAKAEPEPKKEEPKPVVQKPVTQKPTTQQKPATQKPTTQQKPVTQKPATQQKPVTQKPVTQQKQETPKPVEKTPVEEKKVEEPVKEEPKVEDPAPVEPEPPKEPEKPVNDEYERSISGMEGNVSIEDFNDDKQKILQIISELSKVMNEKNYDKWLTYIEPASVTYWQSTSNLAVASQRLPISVRSQLAGNRLRNLREYFVYLFIPARKGRNVDEIRYISPESVKAVQMTEEADLIYYNFKKIDGKWLVHLPVNS